MKIVIGMFIVMCLLMGCSTTTQVINGQTIQLPNISGDVKGAIDLACNDIGFNTGIYNRLYQDRQNAITVQQKKDIDYFIKFCQTPKELREDYGYGWITGAFIDNTIAGIVPYLGQDALSVLRAVGLQ